MPEPVAEAERFSYTDGLRFADQPPGLPGKPDRRTRGGTMIRVV